MQYVHFSQSKLSKRFQIKHIEISNFILASLDNRFTFSNESKSKNSQIWSFLVPQNGHFLMLFCNFFQLDVAF